VQYRKVNADVLQYSYLKLGAKQEGSTTIYDLLFFYLPEPISVMHAPYSVVAHEGLLP
jgi:hypothetical protein